MSAFTEEDVIGAVTIALGNPTVTEYADASKRDALRRALAHYSTYRPLRRIGVFTTVADQQQYDIASSYAYLVGVTDVFYGATGQDLTGYFGNVYDNLVSVSNARGLDTISNESLRVIDDQNTSVMQASNRYEHEMLDDVTVALIPTPEDVRNVYFEYTIIKTVSDLKEREYQDIVDFTFIISGMDLANKRHKILQLNDPSAGFIMFHSGSFLSEQVERARNRLQERLGVSSLALHG